MTAAIQTNNLDALRGFIHHEKLHLDPAAYTPVTNNMQLACEEAARLNHCDAMNLLLDNGCTPTTKVIFAALEGKSTDILDTLISRGWSINSSMGHAGDALILSSACDDLQMVQFLLSRNADPNANTDGNNTALEKAAATASIPVLAALLSAGAIMKGRSALVKAAYHGRSEIAEYLLDQGAEINEVPCNDTITGSCRELEVVNALSMAAFRGQDDVVEVLLDRGADAGVRNPNGKTALELAEEEGNWACVEMLNLYAKC